MDKVVDRHSPKTWNYPPLYYCPVCIKEKKKGLFPWHKIKESIDHMLNPFTNKMESILLDRWFECSRHKRVLLVEDYTKKPRIARVRILIGGKR